MNRVVSIIMLFMLVSTASIAQQINWVTFEEALKLQKKKPKKIMMDVYTNWCGPCKMLDKNTFSNPDVIAYVNKYYYAVKFNAEGNTTETYDGKTFTNPNFKPELANRRNGSHQLTSYLKVSAYPTIIYFDEQGKILSPIRGYQNPQQLELYLKLFQSNKHKEMTKQEDFNAYFSAFKPEFKM